MKVFISWSGHLSKQVAELLREWLPNVLQNVDVWVSSEDIEKGSIWFGEITSEMADTRFGISCLTRENLDAPWILFEAGALSKGLTRNRVSPLLIDLKARDLRDPLARFNATLPERADLLKLVQAISSNSDEPKCLPPERVQRAFDRWWDEFNEKFTRIVNEHPSKPIPKRNMDDMLIEILELSRSLQNQIQDLRLPRTPADRVLGAPITLEDIVPKNPGYPAQMYPRKQEPAV